MKPSSIAEILSRAHPMSLRDKIAHLRGHIASEKGGNLKKTSVRIRELQAALKPLVHEDLGFSRRRQRRITIV